MNIRKITSADHKRVLELNEYWVKVLSPMDADRLVDLLKVCTHAVVFELEQQVVGFMLTFKKGTAYDSVNYRWFAKHLDDFIYIDRVAIDKDFAGLAIGSQAYNWLISEARSDSISSLVAEIDIQPPNLSSLKFHEKFEFQEINHLRHDDGKVVSLQQLTLN